MSKVTYNRNYNLHERRLFGRLSYCSEKPKVEISRHWTLCIANATGRSARQPTCMRGVQPWEDVLFWSLPWTGVPLFTMRAPPCRRTTQMWGYPSRYPKHCDQNIRLTTTQAPANETSGTGDPKERTCGMRTLFFGLQPKPHGTDQAKVSISHQGGRRMLTSTISASAVYHETPQREENSSSYTKGVACIPSL